MSIAGILTTLPWLMNMLRVVLCATGRFARFANWCTEQLNLKREASARGREEGKEQEPRDVMIWLINAMNEGDRAAPPSERAIQEDARTLITAGRQVFHTHIHRTARDEKLTIPSNSDTVAPTFTNTYVFHLPSSPFFSPRNLYFSNNWNDNQLSSLGKNPAGFFSWIL
jgi:hypothetical protein